MSEETITSEDRKLLMAVGEKDGKRVRILVDHGANVHARYDRGIYNVRFYLVGHIVVCGDISCVFYSIRRHALYW